MISHLGLFVNVAGDYGLVPISIPGRIFVVVYALIGIPLMIFLLYLTTSYVKKNIIRRLRGLFFRERV